MYNACSDEELLYMIRLNDEVAMNILLERLNYSVIKTAESIVKRLGCSQFLPGMNKAVTCVCVCVCLYVYI